MLVLSRIQLSWVVARLGNRNRRGAQPIFRVLRRVEFVRALLESLHLFVKNLLQLRLQVFAFTGVQVLLLPGCVGVLS